MSRYRTATRDACSSWQRNGTRRTEAPPRQEKGIRKVYPLPYLARCGIALRLRALELKQETDAVSASDFCFSENNRNYIRSCRPKRKTQTRHSESGTNLLHCLRNSAKHPRPTPETSKNKRVFVHVFTPFQPENTPKACFFSPRSTLQSHRKFAKGTEQIPHTRR